MIAAIPPRAHFDGNTVVYWDDFLTGEEIQVLLALPNWHTAVEAQIQADQPTKSNLRISEVAWFVPTDETQVIWKKIVSLIAEINSQHYGFDLTGCYEPAQLTLYKAGDLGHYGWHIDTDPKTKAAPRKLSMSLLLSNPNEFEGGELQAKPNSDDIMPLEQKQGRAWFFPSYTLHRVAPVTKGVRRSLVLWVGGPPFK